MATVAAPRSPTPSQLKAADDVRTESAYSVLFAGRLEQIGREITARVKKLDNLGAKTVDHVDSIDHLLGEAEKLCKTPEIFEAFKQRHCPDISRSRTYELLAIREGRKSLEDIRASTRARVTKHRAAAKRHVTDKSSVTAAINGQSINTDAFGEAAKKQVESVIAGLPPSWETPTTSEPIKSTAEASAEARKAFYADDTDPAADPQPKPEQRVVTKANLMVIVNRVVSLLGDGSDLTIPDADLELWDALHEAAKTLNKLTSSMFDNDMALSKQICARYNAREAEYKAKQEAERKARRAEQKATGQAEAAA